MERERRAAWVGLAASAVLFGGTWPAGKLLVAHVPPATAAAVRYAIAAAALWAWARVSGQRVRRPSRDELPLLAVLGATVVFGFNLCFFYGLERAPATDASILVPGFGPLLTTSLAWPLLGERPTRRALLGLAVAIGGLVLVVDPAGGAVGARRLAGDGILAGAAACWSVYTLVGRTATERHGSIAANVYAALAGLPLLLPFSFLGAGWGSLGAAPAKAWVSLLYLALLGTVVALVLFYEGVRAVGASKAAASTLLVPIFGVLGSVLVLGERLRPTLAAGGALVLAGVWLVQRN